MKNIFEEIFNISNSIRYVAIYCNSQLTSKQRESLENTSSSESDKYEELFVNPTILKIANQRGNLDCGGLDHITISYNNFHQLIFDYKDGHISICIDKKSNPIELYQQLIKVVEM